MSRRWNDGVGSYFSCFGVIIVGLLLASMLWYCWEKSWILIPLVLALIHCQVTGHSMSPRALSFRWRLPLVMIFGLCRIGEASNPGPEVQFDRDIFTLGTI